MAITIELQCCLSSFSVGIINCHDYVVVSMAKLSFCYSACRIILGDIERYFFDLLKKSPSFLPILSRSPGVFTAVGEACGEV